ncbi:MAG: hypothetical protein U0837_16970 [Dehalococcoidia bacterium]|jgi:hypothetical protein
MWLNIGSLLLLEVRYMPLPRAQVALDQLNKAAAEYAEAKAKADAAQTLFESAAHSLATTRRLAGDILGWWDLWEWESEHREIRYAGMALGEAITSYLTGEAHKAGDRYQRGQDEKPHPWRSLEGIVDALDEGGFQFRTVTPAREANAAITNLKTVTSRKLADTTVYAAADAESILSWYEPPAREETQSKTGAQELAAALDKGGEQAEKT